VVVVPDVVVVGVVVLVGRLVVRGFLLSAISKAMSFYFAERAE